jgi:hypothetical protein
LLLRRSESGNIEIVMTEVSSSARPAATSGDNPATALFEAIVKQQAISATYNRVTVTLAPHILYTRHGDLHIDAVTLDRDGRPPREEKLGTFRVSGLSAIRLTPRRFNASELFDAAEPRYAETTLMAVEA